MEERDIKILEEYLEEARDENSFTDCEGLFEDKFFISLDKLLKRYKELKRINSDLQCEQEQLYDKLYKLEEENKQLRIDNTDKLCEECSELVKQAGITKEDTNRILKEYRDRVENSIPISVIEEKIEELKDKLNKTYNLYGASDFEFIKLDAKIEILQKLLEERNK